MWALIKPGITREPDALMILSKSSSFGSSLLGRIFLIYLSSIIILPVTILKSSFSGSKILPFLISVCIESPCFYYYITSGV